MRETLSAYKEQMRKQTLAKDKLCVISKSPEGKIIDIKVAEWVDTPIVDELKQQAEINYIEYIAKQKKELDDKELLLDQQLANIIGTIEELQIKIEELEHELAIIKGEE
jgi:hypothetical protein